jgi:hypothetical protein
MQWQPRESPISSNSTEYIWPYHLRACLSNSRNYAGDERIGVVPTRQMPWGAQTLLRPAFLRPLTPTINPPPPPFAIQHLVLGSAAYAACGLG